MSHIPIRYLKDVELREKKIEIDEKYLTAVLENDPKLRGIRVRKLQIENELQRRAKLAMPNDWVRR